MNALNFIYLCPQETIKRTQYEETFLIHNIDGAANYRQCV